MRPALGDLAQGIYPHRTALQRTRLSLPAQRALHDQVLMPGDSFGDIGCGHGDDCRNLRQYHGILADGWDPEYKPLTVLHSVDVAGLIYVLNIIPQLDKRSEAL